VARRRKAGGGRETNENAVTLNGTTSAVENSIIVVYGTIQGSYTYESTANWNITVPSIEAKYVDVVG